MCDFLKLRTRRMINDGSRWFHVIYFRSFIINAKAFVHPKIAPKFKQSTKRPICISTSLVRNREKEGVAVAPQAEEILNSESVVQAKLLKREGSRPPVTFHTCCAPCAGALHWVACDHPWFLQRSP